MPFFTRYDHAARIVVVEPRGEISPDEAVAQVRALCKALADLHVRYPEAPYGTLLDTRACATVPTPGEVLRVLDEIDTHGVVDHSTRWAVLATAPAHYGMARLFEIHAETRGVAVRAFNALDEAIGWLSSAPAAAPVP